MLISCWSAKGGAGTTVTSVALATVLANHGDGRGVLLADLAGDVPAVLGIAEPFSPGVEGWMRAGPGVPDDALQLLEVPLREGLSVLPRGEPYALPPDRSAAEALAAQLAADDRHVVVDCGLVTASPVAEVLAASATQSLLVTRACFLALHRAVTLPLRPSGVVLLREPHRALSRVDVEHALGAPVRAEIPLDPNVARAVDSGVLGMRLPRALERALRHAA